MTDPSPTLPTDVAAFLAAVEPERRRAEAVHLDAIFRAETGFAPVLWEGGIIGYGRYDYRYDSGRTGTSLATGFSPRRARHSIYIMPGYSTLGGLLDRLGKHKRGAACLYVNRLTDIDEAILRRIIRQGLKELGRLWPVQPR